jgi:L-fuculose-phosphate aldolase
VRYLDEDQIAIPQQRLSTYEEFEPRQPSSAELEHRRRLCEFARRAYRQRLFISTQGTYSARIDDSAFLITPYGCDRGTVEPQDLVLVRDGAIEAGKVPSRATRTHAQIYRRYSEVGSVINAYPVNATAFSVTDVPLDTRTIPESYIVVRQPARVPYGPQFEDPGALAKFISPRTPAAVLENDGVLVTGADILDAFDRLEVLESTAEAVINCRAIGPMAPIAEAAIRDLRAQFLGE